jgi:carbon-monoxide dehydrogenase large subunit
MENSAGPNVSSNPFGIGRPVPRKEDQLLVRGAGRYTDDVRIPGQAHAVMVRSRHAHGRIRGIDASAALAMPGVLAVYTGADLEAAGFGSLKPRNVIPNRDGTDTTHVPVRPVLPRDKVRFVGEAVACVVAETMGQARDAAEAVELDIEELPALVDADAAQAPGAPLVHETWPGNICQDFHLGDTEAVAAAFAGAACVVKQRLVNSRVVINPLEPRGAVALYDEQRRRWTIHSPSQGVWGLRGALARDVLRTTPDKVHVLTGNVGGSFGMKGQPFPEQGCILHAARALGRPVKWMDERSESFLSDHHGRSAVMNVELALDGEGLILAARLAGYLDAGAFLVSAQTHTTNLARNVIGVFRTPLLEISTKSVLTNKTPVGSYRGAGRPEANYYMNRLIDKAARALGIDAIELRRRNMIPKEAMPYKTPGNATYDSGDFGAVMDHALAFADWDGFAARRRESEARGRLRGRGISTYLESTGPRGKEMGGIRFDDDGGVTIISGTLDYGQGHASPFSQLITDTLGVPFDRIRLLQGDSDKLILGGGTGGSKSMMAAGEAFLAASKDVIERGRRIAGHVLEVDVADVEFRDGRFGVVGTDRDIGIMELAGRLREGLPLPPDCPQELGTALTVDTPAASYPNGCHICEVEVDPDTGSAAVVKYSMVNDFGVIVNPLVVEGQAHGGVVQGIGQVLMERTVYDGEGQPVAASFMDYALPRAADVPMMAFGSHPVPATTNALGVKGCAEAGCAGSMPAVMGALLDALSAVGVTHVDMPATPETVWRAIRRAGTG